MHAVDNLSEEAKQALRLIFDRHMEAGEVASELKTPLPTIRKRLERARQVLGVTSTKAAARILAEYEGRLDQPRLYPPMTMAEPAQPAFVEPPPGVGLFVTWRWGRQNELGTKARVQAILGYAAVAMVLYLAGVAALLVIQRVLGR